MNIRSGLRYETCRRRVPLVWKELIVKVLHYKNTAFPGRPCPGLIEASDRSGYIGGRFAIAKIAPPAPHSP